MVNNQPFTFGGQGSTTNQVYMGRDMKVYPIYETELHSISLLNTFSITLFSLGSALLPGVVEVIHTFGYSIDALKQPVSLGTLLFYTMGTIAIWYSRGTVGKIRKSAYIIPSSASIGSVNASKRSTRKKQTP